jgi:hypothetical protein
VYCEGDAERFETLGEILKDFVAVDNVLWLRRD